MLDDEVLSGNSFALDVRGTVVPRAGKKPFSLKPITAITDKPSPNNWLIKGYLEANTTGLFFGAPASGKSLLVMDMAFCIATGIDWNNCKTTQGDVIYLAGEGFLGIGRRFKVLEDYYSRRADNLFISDQPAQLMDTENADEVVTAINEISKNPALIIIDTLHRNFGAGDENSSRDFGIFINNIDSVFMPLGCTVVIVHHSGHGSVERSRGSSSIRGSLDVEYSVTKDISGNVTLRNTKAKDIIAPDDTFFKITPKSTTWTDEDGEEIVSVHLVPSDEVAISERIKLNARQEKAMLALDIILQDTSKCVDAPSDIKLQYGGFNFDRKIALIDDWRTEFLEQLSSDFDYKNGEKSKAQIDGLKRQAVKRVRDSLYSAKKIVFEGEYIWPYYYTKPVSTQA